MSGERGAAGPDTECQAAGRPEPLKFTDSHVLSSFYLYTPVPGGLLVSTYRCGCHLFPTHVKPMNEVILTLPEGSEFGGREDFLSYTSSDTSLLVF